jgi:TRAP transporter TAXI family solute receptor
VPPPADTAAGAVEITLVGQSVGSGSQLKADAIAEAVRLDHPDWTVTSMAAGGAARLVEKRLAGEADFFLTDGVRPLELEVRGPLFPDIDFESASAYRIVMPSSITQTHFIVNENTGLTSLAAIVEQRYPVTVGCLGFSEQVLSKVLEYYGASRAQAEAWGTKVESVSVASAEGVEALQAGRIDLGITLASIPHSSFLGISDGLRLLPLGEPGLVDLMEEWGYTPTTIPAKTYPFVDAEVPTVGALQSLSTKPGTPDDVVYDVLAAVFNHIDLLVAVHAETDDLLTAGSVAAAISLAERNGEPYHPGALRFYRELGWVP